MPFEYRLTADSQYTILVCCESAFFFNWIL